MGPLCIYELTHYTNISVLWTATVILSVFIVEMPRIDRPHITITVFTVALFCQTWLWMNVAVYAEKSEHLISRPVSQTTTDMSKKPLYCHILWRDSRLQCKWLHLAPQFNPVGIALKIYSVIIIGVKHNYSPTVAAGCVIEVARRSNLLKTNVTTYGIIRPSTTVIPP